MVQSWNFLSTALVTCPLSFNLAEWLETDVCIVA